MKKILYILIGCFTLISCQKELEIDFQSAEQQLVIEATMNQKGTAVSITKTTPIDAPKIDTIRIKEAEVRLCDLTTNSAEILYTDQIGVYRSSTSGVVGHKYLLEVKHQGKIYSKTLTMAPAALGVRLDFGWMNMAGIKMALMQVSVFPYPEETYSYWVRIYRNGKHMAWICACGELVENGRISATMMVGTDPNQGSGMVNDANAMQDGDLITAEVYTVPLGMEDYLNSVKNSTGAHPQFTGAFCLGYMVASPLLTTSITFRPSQIPG